MKRRNFMKALTPSSISFFTFSDKSRNKINIPIHYYISNEVSLSEKNKKSIEMSTKNCINTLSTEDIKVTCDVIFENTKFESSNFEGKRKEVRSISSFQGLNPGIIITEMDHPKNGKATFGCPTCYEEGIMFNGKDLESFNRVIKSNEIINTNTPERSFLTLIHEVGHNLGLRHRDGDSYLENEYIISSIMTSNYVLDELSCETNSEGDSFPCFKEDDYDLIKYKFGFNKNIKNLY